VSPVANTSKLLQPTARAGIVVIGRNEGNRLRECLEVACGRTARLVYVDSGSTDGSVALAKSMGATIVELDTSMPFTAARARNAGFTHLHRLEPNLAYVQFLDGDCRLTENWLDAAAGFLESHLEMAAVFGRLRERYPERSVYNMLCDIEWNTPVGEARACGGVVMMRVAAFEAVHGFRPDIIAGEEPELCIRLRAAGWRIWRLDAEMALHDAAMLQFGQWWKRALRFGHAMAEGASLHGAPPERHWVRETRRAWLWGLVIPSMTLALALGWRPAALLLLLVYPMQVARLALRGRRTPRENWWQAFFHVASKFPEMLGQLKFITHRWLGSRSALIEHK
jgi:GT2 family glycosyltransferase